MANQNNQRGGNSRDINDIANKEKQMRQQLQNLNEEKIRGCDHKARGNGKVMSVHDVKNQYIQNKDKLSETTAYCTRCGAIFEAESYNPDEITGGIYMYNSMLHQIKLNAQLNDDDWDMIDQGFSALDTLARIGVYYNNMVEKLSSGGNKKGGKRNTKGHLGISSDMFNGGRSY